MRSKLLRALAHLKAALAHIAAAKRILREGYMYDLEKAVCSVDEPMKLIGKNLSQVYADVVVAKLALARLPK
jgi:hypothetical protein